MELTEHQKFVLYKIVSEIRGGKTQVTLGGYAGTGKAQPLVSTVYTPYGPKLMGEIVEGDEVCTPTGGKATVTGVFPQGKKVVYRFHFDDGTWADSCADHLWEVIDRTKSSNLKKFKTAKRVYTTAYIVSKIGKVGGDKRFYIPAAICEFEGHYVPVDPYLVGALLGDGSIGDDNFKVTSEDEDILDEVGRMLTPWSCHLSRSEEDEWYYRIGDDKGRGVNSQSVPLRNSMRQLGLWGKTSGTKFIPQLYLSNSITVRKRLLRGLMDTDGTVDRRTGMASLTTTSIRLAQDVVTLLNSIGGKGTIIPKKKWCYYKGEKREVDAFEVNVRLDETSELFSLKRKRSLTENRTRYKIQRAIRSVTILGEQECQCISIDSPDRLYITDNFIATHNTTLAKYVTKFFPDYGVCAFTGKAANVLRKKGIEAKTIHSLIYKPVLEYGRLVGFEMADRKELGCTGFIVDEASMVSKDIYRDLCSYGLPIIPIGDHGQLEPVGSDFNLMEKPDYTLEEIHRNAGNIAHFAEHLRFGRPARRFTECEEVWFRPQRRLFDEHLLEVDQIICAYNSTRVEMNSRIRSALGRTGILNVGERVMCLKNNKTAELFNGMQGVVNALHECPYSGRNMMSFQPDGGDEKVIWYDTKQFGTEKPTMDYMGREYPNPFDYAYCITAHKSQGDEWGKVMVIEQKCKKWDHRRWAYTSASRAKKRLVWAY